MRGSEWRSRLRLALPLKSGRGQPPIAPIGAPLWTITEVAERFRVRPESVRRWVRSGGIQAINLGGPLGYRIAEAELQRFLMARRARNRDASDFIRS